MEKIIPSAFLAFFVFFSATGQVDTIGSGHAVWLDGVDDYIDLGDIYDNVQFPLTISAWVYVPSSSKYILPIFVSQDNASLYNGFWFCLTQTNLFFEYGDGRGDQNPAFRRGKSAAVSNLQNRWIYVSAVVAGANSIELYVNGRNIGGSFTGTSTEPMSSSYPTDIAKIGYFFTNNAVHRYYGWIDELRIWNRLLSEQEIRETMCRRLKGDEQGLIGYWNFDETSGDVLIDSSPNKFHGTLKGNPLRSYSGAPCGNESAFLYTADWMGKSLTKGTATVTNVSAGVYGVHVYVIPHVPSQKAGIDPEGMNLPYYGVFLADDGTENFFNLSFSGGTCRYGQRKDNSVATWDFTDDLSAISHRIEVLQIVEGTPLAVDLGPDLSFCDRGLVRLEGHPDPSGKAFVWSTGETTSAITVTESGIYRVEVSDGCQRVADSISVSLGFSPPSFSLGDDKVVCALEPHTLKPDLEPDGLTLVWQDGSGQTSFQVTEPGTYWLRVSNTCGSSVDSVTYLRQEVRDVRLYNFISPNNTDMVNQFFVIDKQLQGARLTVFNRWGKSLFHSANYQNNWDGEDLPAGVYFYTIQGDCFDPIKGTLTIAR